MRTTERANKLTLFLRNKRAKFSLLLLGAVFLISLGAEFIANDKPLVVRYENQWLFPIFTNYSDADFGGDFPTSADYKDVLTVNNINQKGWAIFPLIPYSFNTVDYDLQKPTPSAPDTRHWLGTDDEGRDVLARILYGLRLSIIFAFIPIIGWILDFLLVCWSIFILVTVIIGIVHACKEEPYEMPLLGKIHIIKLPQQ